MTQLEIAQKHEIEKLQEKLQLMIQLSTREGFYKFYFSKLNEYETNVKCFNEINEIYRSIFGEYRYSDFNSFRKFTNFHKKTR